MGGQIHAMRVCILFPRFADGQDVRDDVAANDDGMIVQHDAVRLDRNYPARLEDLLNGFHCRRLYFTRP